MGREYTAFYGNQPYEFNEWVPAPLEYTEKDIEEQLKFKRGTNEINFRYDLLDKRERKIRSLTSVVSGEISMTAFAEIKRTAKFTILEDVGEEIDWLNDRIQPYCLLKMPNGTWVEWSLGIFILSSPTRYESNNRVYRDVEAYDGLIVLKNDKTLGRYIVPKNMNYVTAIYKLLRESGITKINIEQTDLELNVDKEYDAGTEIRQIINDLLSEINWTTLWVDEDGYFRASKYVSPLDQPANINYIDDELSVLKKGMSEELDITNVANSWSVIVSNPEEEPLVSIYRNVNPESPTSIISRGRTIVDFREKDNISSQMALDEYVKRIAFEASQVYGYLRFETAINPLHSYGDIINLRYKLLNIEGKYSETNWTMPLQAGQSMRHEVRKVVEI